jgi:TPP-dependent pyruvate/acetoin dehydrogenase alpha subunit
VTTAPALLILDEEFCMSLESTVKTNFEQPSRQALLDMFQKLYLIRRFEETANELYMQGVIPSTLHLYIGQEAVAVGVSAHLREDDYVLSTHRPHGHALAKGVSPNAIMAELFGKATGTCKGKGGSMHVGDMSVGMLPAIAIVGGNAPISAGAALAFKLQGSERVSVCYFGDGATNEGAWHEAMNAAAIWDLPVVFVCENNLYAASTPFHLAFRIDSVAQRAQAYGIPAVVVDGNDLLAVYQAAKDAVGKARGGAGPTLIECMTYRLCGHSRSDPRTYRTKEEEDGWQAKDPLPRFKSYLLSEGEVTQAQITELELAVEEALKSAIAFAESSPEPELADLYTDVFKE